MANYKLQELWDLFSAQTVTPAQYIKTEFNKLTNIGVEAMSNAEASGMIVVIENRLTRLMKCTTIYEDDDLGIDSIKATLKANLYSMVSEIRNMVKALSKDIASVHSRSKFNPLDNTDIDNAADESDNTTFTYVANMISQIDYLKDNSKTLEDLYYDLENICYIIKR